MKPYYEDEATVLYLGDCREVLPGIERVALTVTSPPYWNARTYEGVGWATYDAYLVFVNEVMRALIGVTGWLAWIAGYIWKDGRLYDCAGDAARVAEACGFQWRQQVPWIKEDFAPQPSIDLAPAHELIQVMRSQDAPQARFDLLRVSRRQAERLGRVATERPSWGSQRGGGVGWGHERFDGMKQAPNVLVTAKLNGANRLGHPAAYPPEVVDPWVAACTSPAEVVLDPFAGSGTTLRVAKDMGRRAIGIELSERYCEIAAKRLSQETLAFACDEVSVA